MTKLVQQTGLIAAIRGCASWQCIQAKWRNFPEKQKGDLFEELVKAYLQLEPEYASKLKHVWLQREIPQAAARKLKLPPPTKASTSSRRPTTASSGPSNASIAKTPTIR